MTVDYLEDDLFEPALDRLDEILYGGDLREPDCMWCWDHGCRECRPSPRQRRRERHREWQRRDRLPREVAAGLVVLWDEGPF